jgi:hypothetical protein
MNGSSTTFDFTKHYQYSRTTNNICTYYSQNVYSDSALTERTYSQLVPTASNLVVDPIHYPVDLSVPGK